MLDRMSNYMADRMPYELQVKRQIYTMPDKMADRIISNICEMKCLTEWRTISCQEIYIYICQIDKMSGYTPRWGSNKAKQITNTTVHIHNLIIFGQSPWESSIKAIAPRSPQQCTFGCSCRIPRHYMRWPTTRTCMGLRGLNLHPSTGRQNVKCNSGSISAEDWLPLCLFPP